MSSPLANGTGTSAMCPKSVSAVSNGVWQGDNPLEFALPLLIVQICLVLIVTRVLAFLLRPFRQPRVIAEIIGGILLGPSALGRNGAYISHIFPKQSITVLDTIADLGLIFFLFLVGLELDLHAIRRTGKQALSIAAAGICVPFIAGVGASVVLHRTIASDGRFAPFLVFMGVAMSITAFPVLARILAERKLLTTDVGQMAMSAAAVNDMAAWILLALAVALSGSGKSPLIAIWVFLCGLAFVVVMFVAVRPLLALFARQAVENEPANELHVAITLAGVLVSGLATDAIGIHAIFGAFVFGLIIPKEGAFATMMIEKIEDFVTVLMLPLYFASSGLKTNIASIRSAQSFSLLLLVIATACIGKVLGTFAVASLHKMGPRKSLTLGFLMNTKGLVELIVLNIGKDRKVLNDETFAIMVLMALVTTFITTPIVMALYKPARNQVPYSRRALYVPGSKEDAELRVLACVHGMPNVHAIINLIEASRGTRKRTLRMYILHLLEFTERPSSIMRVQKVRTNGLPSSDYHDNMDNVVLAFEAYGQLSKVIVQAMTAISNFDDVHEDICAIAGQKRACFIVMPFHKHARLSDGTWEGNNPGLRNVNAKVLLHAPCSVGILVDRGIGMDSLSSNHVDHKVAVLFFGGPDDREALAFGYRMVEHPGVKLKVFHIIQGPPSQQSRDHVPISVLSTASERSGRHSRRGPDRGNNIECSRFARIAAPASSAGQGSSDPLAASNDSDKLQRSAEEADLDEECLAMVKEAASSRVTMVESSKGMMATRPIVFEERAIDANPIDVAVEIGRSEDFTLLLMGRGRTPPPMLARLVGRQVEFPELGLIGDALITHSHHTHSSILVIQRHDPDLVKEEIVDSRKVGDASFAKTNHLLSRGHLVVSGPRSPSLQSSPGRDNVGDDKVEIQEKFDDCGEKADHIHGDDNNVYNIGNNRLNPGIALGPLPSSKSECN